ATTFSFAATILSAAAWTCSAPVFAPVASNTMLVLATSSTIGRLPIGLAFWQRRRTRLQPRDHTRRAVRIGFHVADAVVLDVFRRAPGIGLAQEIDVPVKRHVNRGQWRAHRLFVAPPQPAGGARVDVIDEII